VGGQRRCRWELGHRPMEGRRIVVAVVVVVGVIGHR